MSTVIEGSIANDPDIDIKEQVSQHISELLTELGECREDERNTQNQILQIISVSCAVLGVLFGIGFFKSDSNNSNMFSFSYPTAVRLLFFLSCLVFCTAFTYIVTLGIQNVLRYHYVQDIEERLANLIPSQQEGSSFTHWGRYSAPIITRNVYHLSSRHTVIYYFCYTTAAICAITFCITLIAIQFIMITPKEWFDWLCFIIFFAITNLTVCAFFYICAKARNVADYAFKTAINRRNNVDTSYHKTFFHNFRYFVYPRTNDLQKPLLIIASCLTFAILFNQITPATFYHLFISLIVFDLLACQARFQINDIRGWKEDLELGKHTLENKNKARLVANHMNKNNQKKLIWLSLLIACGKIIVAILLTLFLGKAVKNQLLICFAILSLSTISYEYVRSRNNKSNTSYYTHLIFILVGSGYPLRVAVGALAACPNIWKSSETISLEVKILIIIALWAHERVDEKEP